MNRRLMAVVKSRFLEVLRDRSALAWNLLFAPMLVIGMAVVFSGGGQTVAKVGVLCDRPLAELDDAFLTTPAVQFYREDAGAETQAIAKVGHQRIDLLLDLRGDAARYWINPDSAKGRLLQRLLQASLPQARAQTVNGPRISYADWLVPGLLALNIMFSSLYAIGHVLVRYRNSGYLKRLNGTPLRPLEFLGGQLIACLVLCVIVTAGIYAACSALLDLRMAGSYLALLLVTVLGAMALIAMSLLVAARVVSEELSNGLVNLIAWPMLVMSGAVFSLDGAPAVLRAVAQLFPLTHMLTAARAVMLDGAGLATVAPSLWILAGMTAFFLVLGMSTFRWSQE